MPFWEGNNSVSQISTTTTHDVGVGFLFNTNKIRVNCFFQVVVWSRGKSARVQGTGLKNDGMITLYGTD